MINYSVIIPHKNCVNLVCKCVSMIPDRNDIEIIVIDDNSSNKIDLQAELAKINHLNLSLIITTEGKGAGFARNQGVKVARGKWLVFSDADDYYDQNAFDIFDEYLDSDYDIVFFEHTGINIDTGERIERSEYRIKLIEDYLDSPSPKTETFLRYNNAVPWAKMVKQELVREYAIDFEEVPASNDTMFSTKIGHYAKSISADKRSVYWATARKGSITHTKSKERYFSDYGVYVRRNSFLKSIGHKECSTRILSLVINSLISYGLKEFWKYIKYAYNYKVNIFYGEGDFVSKLGRKVKKFFTKDELIVKV